MKIEWLIINATAIKSPIRAEHEVLGAMLDIFWTIQAAFGVREPFCDMEIPYRLQPIQKLRLGLDRATSQLTSRRRCCHGLDSYQ